MFCHLVDPSPCLQVHHQGACDAWGAEEQPGGGGAGADQGPPPWQAQEICGEFN